MELWREGDVVSEGRPAPYPADTRAKGWRFELDYEKLDQSDTWGVAAKKGPDVQPWLLMMWLTAWRQEPCGSFTNDEEVIAAKILMPDKTWTKYRAVMMRGWWLAIDGRLYHDTITARVLSMLAKRAGDAERAATRRARKADSAANPPELPPGVTRDSTVSPPEVGDEFDTKHQAVKIKHPPTPRKRGSVHGFPPGFETFWAAYPRKVAKPSAAKAFARLRPDDAMVATMLTALQRQSSAWTEQRFIPHPSTWLSGRRWEDEEPGRSDVFAGAQ